MTYRETKKLCKIVKIGNGTEIQCQIDALTRCAAKLRAKRKEKIAAKKAAREVEKRISLNMEEYFRAANMIYS